MWDKSAKSFMNNRIINLDNMWCSQRLIMKTNCDERKSHWNSFIERSIYNYNMNTYISSIEGSYKFDYI